MNQDDRVQYLRFGEGVPPVRGHYSHLVWLPNGLFYVAGQKAWDPNTGELVPGTIEEQTHLIFDNLIAVLSAARLGLADVTRISCHLAEIEMYDAFNDVYSERLGATLPARTVLGGYQLRDGALIELVVEGFARRPDRTTDGS